MATTENVPITAGTGTYVAVDAIVDKDTTGATINHQRVKLETGPDGTACDVSVFAPVPVVSAALENLLTSLLVELRVANVIALANNDPYGDLEQYRQDEKDALATVLNQNDGDI